MAGAYDRRSSPTGNRNLMGPDSETSQQAMPIESVYRYCPRCGKAGTQVGKIPFRCDQCGMASFFGPVAAVGGLVRNDRNEVLLVVARVIQAKDVGGCRGICGPQ